jgi:hypothetical protein
MRFCIGVSAATTLMTFRFPDQQGYLRQRTG